MIPRTVSARSSFVLEQHIQGTANTDSRRAILRVTDLPFGIDAQGLVDRCPDVEWRVRRADWPCAHAIRFADHPAANHASTREQTRIDTRPVITPWDHLTR